MSWEQLVIGVIAAAGVAIICLVVCGRLNEPEQTDEHEGGCDA